MSGKTISNGTLSLRFMQNAQRAKEQATTELGGAKVKDEAEWEVPKEIREAWGVVPRTQLEQTIEQETSYLPFLFPSLHRGSDITTSPDDNTPTPKINGRRTFNKGKEVTNPVLTSKNSSNAAKAVKRESSNRETHITGQGNDHPEGEQKTSLSNTTAPAIPIRKGKQPRPGAGTGPLTNSKASKMAKLDRDGLLPPGGRELLGVPVLSMITSENTELVGVDMRTVRKLKAEEQNQQRSISAEMTAPTFPAASGSEQTVDTVTSIGSGPIAFQRPAGIDSPVSSPHKKKSKKRPRDDLLDNSTIGKLNGRMKGEPSTPSKGQPVIPPPGFSQPAESIDSLRQSKKKKKQQGST